MTDAARIPIQVSGHLRDHCGASAEVAVSARTVREALEGLEHDHAALHRSVCDETGTVRRHIGVFVNASHIRDLDGLDTVLAPGDVMIILPAISGG